MPPAATESALKILDSFYHNHCRLAESHITQSRRSGIAKHLLIGATDEEELIVSDALTASTDTRLDKVIRGFGMLVAQGLSEAVILRIIAWRDKAEVDCNAQQKTILTVEVTVKAWQQEVVKLLIQREQVIHGVLKKMLDSNQIITPATLETLTNRSMARAIAVSQPGDSAIFLYNSSYILHAHVETLRILSHFDLVKVAEPLLRGLADPGTLKSSPFAILLCLSHLNLDLRNADSTRLSARVLRDLFYLLPGLTKQEYQRGLCETVASLLTPVIEKTMAPELYSSGLLVGATTTNRAGMPVNWNVPGGAIQAKMRMTSLEQPSTGAPSGAAEQALWTKVLQEFYAKGKSMLKKNKTSTMGINLSSIVLCAMPATAFNESYKDLLSNILEVLEEQGDRDVAVRTYAIQGLHRVIWTRIRMLQCEDPASVDGLGMNDPIVYSVKRAIELIFNFWMIDCGRAKQKRGIVGKLKRALTADDQKESNTASPSVLHEHDVLVWACVGMLETLGYIVSDVCAREIILPLLLKPGVKLLCGFLSVCSGIRADNCASLICDDMDSLSELSLKSLGFTMVLPLTTAVRAIHAMSVCTCSAAPPSFTSANYKQPPAHPKSPQPPIPYPPAHLPPHAAAFLPCQSEIFSCFIDIFTLYERFWTPHVMFMITPSVSWPMLSESFGFGYSLDIQSGSRDLLSQTLPFLLSYVHIFPHMYPKESINVSRCVALLAPLCCSSINAHGCITLKREAQRVLKDFVRNNRVTAQVFESYMRWMLSISHVSTETLINSVSFFKQMLEVAIVDLKESDDTFFTSTELKYPASESDAYKIEAVLTLLLMSSSPSIRILALDCLSTFRNLIAITLDVGGKTNRMIDVLDRIGSSVVDSNRNDITEASTTTAKMYSAQQSTVNDSKEQDSLSALRTAAEGSNPLQQFNWTRCMSSLLIQLRSQYDGEYLKMVAHYSAVRALQTWPEVLYNTGQSSLSSRRPSIAQSTKQEHVYDAIMEEILLFYWANSVVCCMALGDHLPGMSLDQDKRRLSLSDVSKMLFEGLTATDNRRGFEDLRVILCLALSSCPCSDDATKALADTANAYESSLMERNTRMPSSKVAGLRDLCLIYRLHALTWPAGYVASRRDIRHKLYRVLNECIFVDEDGDVYAPATDLVIDDVPVEYGPTPHKALGITLLAQNSSQLRQSLRFNLALLIAAFFCNAVTDRSQIVISRDIRRRLFFYLMERSGRGNKALSYQDKTCEFAALVAIPFTLNGSEFDQRSLDPRGPVFEHLNSVLSDNKEDVYKCGLEALSTFMSCAESAVVNAIEFTYTLTSHVSDAYLHALLSAVRTGSVKASVPVLLSVALFKACSPQASVRAWAMELLQWVSINRLNNSTKLIVPTIPLPCTPSSYLPVAVSLCDRLAGDAPEIKELCSRCIKASKSHRRNMLLLIRPWVQRLVLTKVIPEASKRPQHPLALAFAKRGLSAKIDDAPSTPTELYKSAVVRDDDSDDEQDNHKESKIVDKKSNQSLLSILYDVHEACDETECGAELSVIWRSLVEANEELFEFLFVKARSISSLELVKYLDTIRSIAAHAARQQYDAAVRMLLTELGPATSSNTESMPHTPVVIDSSPTMLSRRDVAIVLLNEVLSLLVASPSGTKANGSKRPRTKSLSGAPVPSSPSPLANSVANHVYTPFVPPPLPLAQLLHVATIHVGSHKPFLHTHCLQLLSHLIQDSLILRNDKATPASTKKAEELLILINNERQTDWSVVLDTVVKTVIDICEGLEHDNGLRIEWSDEALSWAQRTSSATLAMRSLHTYRVLSPPATTDRLTALFRCLQTWLLCANSAAAGMGVSNYDTLGAPRDEEIEEGGRSDVVIGELVTTLHQAISNFGAKGVADHPGFVWAALSLLMDPPSPHALALVHRMLGFLTPASVASLMKSKPATWDEIFGAEGIVGHVTSILTAPKCEPWVLCVLASSVSLLSSDIKYSADVQIDLENLLGLTDERGWMKVILSFTPWLCYSHTQAKMSILGLGSSEDINVATEDIEAPRLDPHAVVSLLCKVCKQYGYNDVVFALDQFERIHRLASQNISGNMLESSIKASFAEQMGDMIASKWFNKCHSDVTAWAAACLENCPSGYIQPLLTTVKAILTTFGANSDVSLYQALMPLVESQLWDQALETMECLLMTHKLSDVDNLASTGETKRQHTFRRLKSQGSSVGSLMAPPVDRGRRKSVTMLDNVLVGTGLPMPVPELPVLTEELEPIPASPKNKRHTQDLTKLMESYKSVSMNEYMEQMGADEDDDN